MHYRSAFEWLRAAIMVLLLFGTIAVATMLLMYALEERAHWFVLGFAVASALAATYGALIEAWPFAVIEALWSVIALRRWWGRYSTRVLNERREERELGVAHSPAESRPD